MWWRYGFRARGWVNSFMRRSYHVDRNNVHHFKPQGLRWWIRQPKDVTTIALLGSLGCALYITNLETVPYTSRRRPIIWSGGLERWYGERWFEKDKSFEFKGKILPPSHPDDARVQKIAKEVIGAARRELRKDRHRGAQTAHMEEFEWEVIVVDGSKSYACCYPAGKIVVYTSLLRAYESDDDNVAFVIGHEVGHAIGRHAIELQLLWHGFMWGGFLLYHFTSIPIGFLLYYFLELYYSRRIEREADYIGLLSAASAGYDPRAVAREYKKYLEMKTPILQEYLSTHPPIEKKAQFLTDPKVVEEALSI